MKRKMLALLLALLLALGLAACGKTESGADTPATAGPAQAGDGGQTWDGVDAIQEILGFSGDSTMIALTEGRTVDASNYLYWLGNMAAYYDNMYSYYGIELDFTQEIGDGVTWDERLKELAFQNAVLLEIVPALAEEYGAALTQEDLDALNAEREAAMEQAGGEEAYLKRLKSMGIDDATDFEIGRRSALFDKVQTAYTEKVLSGEGPDAVTPEAMEAFLKERGLMRAKHILLLTKDMSTNEPYSDVTIAAQKAKAEGLKAQLDVAEDPQALFDVLMKENSEDPGVTTNPDGYLFSAGEMVTEFEEGTRALAVGEISDVIESTYGYHIILRVSADCDESRASWAQDSFNKMVSDRLDRADARTTELYDTFTAQGFYEGLRAFAEKLNADEGGEP